MKAPSQFRLSNLTQLNTWLISLIAAVSIPSHVHAEKTQAAMWKKSLQFHGFVTQGLIKTDENQYYGNSTEGSAELTEIGFNGSSRISNNLLASAQILARRAGESYDGSAELDYALLDYSIANRETVRYGVRFGRFKNPIGLYNDTRDVAYTRPGIFLPQSIYYDNLRNALLSNDGALFYSEFWSGDHHIDFQLGMGKTPVDLNVEYALIGEDLPGNLTDKDLTLVSRLMYEFGHFKAGISYANTTMKVENTIPQIGNGQYEIDIWVLSLQYLYENWTFTAEWGAQPISWKDFSAFFPVGSSGENDPGGYFVQTSYTLNPDIELMIRYEEGYSDRNDKDGTEREAFLASLPVPIISPAHNYFTKDLTLGVRFDISNQFMIMAEVHDIEGTSILSRRENNVATTVKDWRLYSLLASYRF